MAEQARPINVAYYVSCITKTGTVKSHILSGRYWLKKLVL